MEFSNEKRRRVEEQTRNHGLTLQSFSSIPKHPHDHPPRQAREQTCDESVDRQQGSLEGFEKREDELKGTAAGGIGRMGPAG